MLPISDHSRRKFLAQCWPILPNLGPFCPILGPFCPILAHFAQFGPILPISCPFCPILVRFAQFCSVLLNFGPFCPKILFDGLYNKVFYGVISARFAGPFFLYCMPIFAFFGWSMIIITTFYRACIKKFFCITFDRWWLLFFYIFYWSFLLSTSFS